MTREGIAAALRDHIAGLPDDQWKWWMGDGRFVTEEGVSLKKVCRIATDYLCDLFGADE